jgi:hypothetical protein
MHDPIFDVIKLFEHLKSEMDADERDIATEAVNISYDMLESMRPITIAGFRAKLHALANEDVVGWMFPHQEVLHKLLDDLDGIDLEGTDETADDELEAA